MLCATVEILIPFSVLFACQLQSMLVHICECLFSRSLPMTIEGENIRETKGEEKKREREKEGEKERDKHNFSPRLVHKATHAGLCTDV